MSFSSHLLSAYIHTASTAGSKDFSSTNVLFLLRKKKEERNVQFGWRGEMVNLFFLQAYLSLSLLLDYVSRLFTFLVFLQRAIGAPPQKKKCHQTLKRKETLIFKHNILVKCTEKHLKSLFLQIIKELLNERKSIKHIDIFYFTTDGCVILCE